MPAFYALEGTGEPTLDWFHKYVVARIDVDDLVTDQPNTTTFYDYLDGAAWHYNTDEITKDKYRTWGDWRGYSRVRVRQGDPTGVQTEREFRYLRGMDGDKAPSQPGGVRDVWVSDSWGGTVEDHEALQGFELQTTTLNGVNGAEVTSTVNRPWRHGPTATRTRNGVTTNAWVINQGSTRTRTALQAGGYRTTRTDATYTNEGLDSTTDNWGDEAVTGDETCTRKTYARNEAIWMIAKEATAETLSVACSAATTPAAPSTVLARTRTAYDAYSGEVSFGAAPTRGNVVRSEVLDRFNGSTPVYVATTQNSTYDANGRVLSVTDALGKTTSTTYVTANGGQVTSSTVTNPLSQQAVSEKHPAWDLPMKTTDPNGAVSEFSYDGLGRLIAVWLPGRTKASQTPNLKFAYLLRNSGGPTAVTTETLLPPGNGYKKSVNLYDGFLRQRQAQIQATGGGRLLSDTFYDTLGNEAWTSAAYYDNTNTPPGTSLGTPQGQIPAITQRQYDGAGRQTAEIFLDFGVEKWRTTTIHGGDRTHTVPPDGGTATTAITDVLGQTVEVRQYHDPAQVGSTNPAHYDATTYTYDLGGALTLVTDPAGNQWRYDYDLRGHQISATDPDKGTTTTYDVAGNVLTTTSPLGAGTATLAYTYDDLGRKTSLRDNTADGPKRAEWIYGSAPGGIGKLHRSIRYVGSAQYESRVDYYDSAGRARSTTVVLPATEGGLCAAGGTAPCQYTTSLTYRVNGAPSQTTMPAVADLPSERLTFGYNDIGEQTTLLSAGQIYVNTVTYNKLGQMIQRQLGATGSRIAITSILDEPSRRVTSTSVLPELKPEAARWEYSYDDSGNVTRIAEAPTGGVADVQCFTHDYLGRLSDAWTPSNGTCTAPSTSGLGGPAPYWRSWTYDTAGNRLTETRHASAGDTVDTYAYPAPGSARPHAVTGVQSATAGASVTRGFTYDNAGNLKTRQSDDGDQQTYTFDAEGHVATVIENGVTTSHVYDADGNRLIRRDASGSVLYLANGTEVRLAAGASVATATRYYSHVNATIAMRTAAGLTWLVGDHHNTAEVTINRTTLAVAKRRTLPFGGERGTDAGWPSSMDKGFVGGTKDNTGLTHLGLREYDPVLGGFISVDPVIDVTQPHQLNPYAYAHHNPVTLSDPTGAWPSFLDKAVSKVASVAAPIVKKAASTVASAATKAGNAVGSFVASTVESIKQDPLKFAVGLAVGIAATVAVAAVCSTGVGCLILAGAVAGAAAGAEYGVDVAQGDREFSIGDLATEMVIGGAVGAATAGLGAGASKLVSGARNFFGGAKPRPGGRPPSSCGCRCSVPLSFTPDTRVLLASGAAVAIASLGLGDLVLASDPKTGQTAAQPVTALIAHEDVELADLTITEADGTTAVIHTTPDHPFWNETTQSWTQAGDLLPGDRLSTPNAAPATVVGVAVYLQTQVMYNLTVSDIHTYYVLADGTPVLVHNRPGDGSVGDVGTWYQLYKDRIPNTEIHHIPPKATNPTVRPRHGLSIRMEWAHHRALLSSNSDARHLMMQRDLIASGRLDLANELEYDDMRRVAGNQYDDAIERHRQATFPDGGC